MEIRQRDLRDIPELALLDIVRLILSKPGALSERDRAELYVVNRELARRELESIRAQKLAARRERYKVNRLEKLIREALHG